MSGPENYGPSAGYHPAPDQHFDQPYQPPPDPRYQSYEGPQHAAYDPHSGHPIPPGYVPPSRPPPSNSEYFPPPPRQEYNEDHWDERAPRGGYEQARDGYEERPYAPEDPHGHEYNQVTPFDEDRARAEERRGWEEEEQRRYAQQYPPPPPSDYGRRDRAYDDRDRERDRRDNDRYYDYRRDDRDRYTYSDDLSSYDSRDRRYDRDRDSRRRDSRNSPTKTGKDIFGAREGQRGLSAQILGGAMGGLAGHEAGGSILETLGGVVVGAMGAKVLENQYEKRRTKKEAAAKNAAPFKDDAIRDRRSSYPNRPPREDRNFRDDRDYIRDRTRSRSRSRRGDPRRRNSMDDYSDYSPSRYSPPPPRR